MSLEISETRPNAFESVSSFCGFSVAPGGPPARPFLSLTAETEGQLVGAIVCPTQRSLYSSTCLTVRSTGVDPLTIVAQLVGEATRKLQCHNMHQCRIAVREPSDDTETPEVGRKFWESVEWPELPDLSDAQHVVRVIGRH